MARGGDRWLEEYNRACDIAEDVEPLIYERNQLEQQGQNSQKTTSQIRRFLNDLALAVQTLEDLVNSAHKQYHITDSEFDMRQRKINDLKLRRDELQHSFSMDPLRSSSGGNGYSNPGFNPMSDDPDLVRQQQIMQEQDSGLDIIQQSIMRQKQMGLAISNEIDEQNVMLDDLGDNLHRSNSVLQDRTNQIVRVTEKAKGQGLCCCIGLLLIAIVVVLSV